MSLLSLASGASASRGYDYYEAHKVVEWSKACDGVYHGVGAGSYGSRYRVTIDVYHPRKNSTCTCPHASGTHRICKHMVALYFTTFPKEAETYYREAVLAAEEAEEEAEQLENAIISRVHGMSKDELSVALLTLLFEGPEWQLNRFINEYLDPFDEDPDYDGDSEEDSLFDDDEDL